MLVGAGPFPDQGDALLDRGPHREDGELELHPTGFDLGQVEDLVQQLQQVLPGRQDVAQVLLLPIVEVAEHPLEQHLGEADDGVERGSELVGHAGEEVGLVLAGNLELGLVPFELAEDPRVEHGEGGLTREGLDVVQDLVGELPDRLPADDHPTDDLVVAEHGNGEHRAPAVVPEQLQVDVTLHHGQIRQGDRVTLQRGPADQGLVEIDPERAEGGQQCRVLRIRRPGEEALLLLDEVHDRSAVALGDPDRVLDDREQHLVQHETRADGLPDLLQGLELFDLAGELDPPTLEGAHEVDVADGRRRLSGERLQDEDRAVVEGVDLGPPDADGADHLVVEDEGHRDHRAVTAEGLDVGAAVLGVGQHVDHLVNGAVDRDPARQRRPIQSERVFVHVGLEVLGETGRGGEDELLAGHEIDLDSLTAAEAQGGLGHGGEHRIGIGGGAPEGDQDLVGGGELVDDVVSMAPEIQMIISLRLGITSAHPLASPRAAPAGGQFIVLRRADAGQSPPGT